MKKFLFILIGVFCVSNTFGQKITTLNDEENAYIKVCIEKQKVPYIHYPIGEDLVFSIEKNDYIGVKLTSNERAYYKQLNKVYSNCYNYITKTKCQYEDITANAKSYKIAIEHNKFNTKLIVGSSLISAGVITIVGGNLYVNNKEVDRNIYDYQQHLKNVSNITNIIGGVMAITGTILTIDAIKKENQSLRIGVNQVSYQYNF